jgi:hypothetical protein
VEGIEPIDRDAAAHHVEVRALVAVEPCAVRGVDDHAVAPFSHLVRERLEALDLMVEVIVTGFVRRGEVGHGAG